MSFPRWRLLVAVVLLGLAAAPPAAAGTRHCVVIGPPHPAHGSAAVGTGGDVVVTVPRLHCSGGPPVKSGGQGGGAELGGANGGGIPFTGFDAVPPLRLAAALLAAGVLALRAGSRRRLSRRRGPRASSRSD